MATSNNDSQQKNYKSNQRPPQNRRSFRPHAHNKRPHASSSSAHVPPQWNHHNNYEDEEVDDLVVAAQYAFALPTPTQPSSISTTTSPPQLKEDKEHLNTGPLSNQSDMMDNMDENEIDLDEDEVVSSEACKDDLDDNTNSKVLNDDGTKSEVNVDDDIQNDGPVVPHIAVVDMEHHDEIDDDDDDDDAESEVDLLEQLAHMVGEEDDDDEELEEYDDDVGEGNSSGKNKSSRPMKNRNKPMTVNEIDAYQADLHQIHDLLQNNVSIAENVTSLPRSSTSTTSSRTTNNPIQLPGTNHHTIAGHIQHHMVDERTIVILSYPGGILLKEGTALIIHRKDVTTTNVNPCMNNTPTGNNNVDNTDMVDSNKDNNNDIIPLGIILEIFGPVGQPLYSVRLPLPPPPIKETKFATKETQLEPKLTRTERVEGDVEKDAHETTHNETETVDITTSAIVEQVELVEHSPDISAREKTESTDVENVGNETTNNETTTNAITAASILEQIEPVEHVQNIASKQEIVDPWSWSGEYTKMIHSFPKLPVYYWNDPASTNVLDTEAVIRNSGRGCDASNLFDEEIIDVQDYSDDEQERAAKGNRNKKNHGTNGSSTGSSDLPHHREPRSTNPRNQGKPTNHRVSSVHQPNRSRFAAVPGGGGGYMPPPQPPMPGFHPHSVMPGAAAVQNGGGIGAPYYPTYPTPQYYATPNLPGVPMNPSHFAPPQQQGFYIPPPQQFQQPWYYYNGAYQSVPPPPPPRAIPPNSTQHPPSSQGGSTDTVYYDFS